VEKKYFGIIYRGKLDKRTHPQVEQEVKFFARRGELEGVVNLVVLACVLRTATKIRSTTKSAPLEKILATPIPVWMPLANNSQRT